MILCVRACVHSWIKVPAWELLSFMCHWFLHGKVFHQKLKSHSVTCTVVLKRVKGSNFWTRSVSSVHLVWWIWFEICTFRLKERKKIPIMVPLLLLEVNDDSEDEWRKVNCCFNFLCLVVVESRRHQMTHGKLQISVMATKVVSYLSAVPSDCDLVFCRADADVCLLENTLQRSISWFPRGPSAGWQYLLRTSAERRFRCVMAVLDH